MTKWAKSKWHAFLEKYYTRKMNKFYMLAQYNLHRHNEALNMYINKKSYREMNPSENGFFVANEYADRYINGYNYNWESYIEYKHKLDSLKSLYNEMD